MEFLYYFLILSFLYLLNNYLFAKPAKLPPGPSRLPIIGSLHHFLKGSKVPQRKLSHLAKGYGPLMYLKLGQMHAVVVSSKQIAEEMLKTHDVQLAERAFNGAMGILTYDNRDVAFSPYDGYWRQMRKICVTELLSPRRVQSFKSIREEEAASIVRYIRSVGAAPVNITQQLGVYTTGALSRAAFGSKCADADEFLAVTDEGQKLLVSIDFADFFPSWWLVCALSGVRRRARGLWRRYDRVLSKIVRDHKQRRMMEAAAGALDEDNDKEDLVDVLLRIKEQENLEYPLTDDHVKATILDMFAAGGDTSIILMDWAMVELMKNPRVMAKVQAEIRAVLKGKEEVTTDDLKGLPYLNMVIKETLRLHPSVPLLLPRKCREACEVAGYHIPKGTTVMINAWALARDPEYWDKPEEFYPERFESNGGSINYKGANFEFIPFGSGKRMCPGMSFGMALADIVLAQLLYHFDWKLPDGVMPEDVDVTEIDGSGWNRATDLFVCATPYKI